MCAVLEFLHFHSILKFFIPDDVNFSSDLSDFRHRHNIRIILIHRGRAHQSLIACAHEHYEFSSIANDLPPRSPLKVSF